MKDYEGMILARQDDIYDGIIEQDDQIEVRDFDFKTGTYKTTKVLKGEAARQYMAENGIW